jgi:hypothetical protein
MPIAKKRAVPGEMSGERQFLVISGELSFRLMDLKVSNYI